MINNTEIIDEYRDVLKLQTGSQQIPASVNSQIIPVLDINPKHARYIKYIKTLTADGDLLPATATVGRDFYIVAIMLANTSAVGAAGTTTNVTATVGGVNSTIADLKHPTLTVGAENMFYGYPLPIKIDNGTAVATTSGAGITFRATLFGYFVDNPRA
jgi:hypothetical protein